MSNYLFVLRPIGLDQRPQAFRFCSATQQRAFRIVECAGEQGVGHRTTDEYGSPALRSKFAEAKYRDVTLAIPQIVAGIVAIAVTRQENRAADARRQAAREEAERQRRAAERRAARERARVELLETLLAGHDAQLRLARWLEAVEAAAGSTPPEHVNRLLQWAGVRLEAMRAASGVTALEVLLRDRAVFPNEAEL